MQFLAKFGDQRDLKATFSSKLGEFCSNLENFLQKWCDFSVFELFARLVWREFWFTGNFFEKKCSFLKKSQFFWKKSHFFEKKKSVFLKLGKIMPLSILGRKKCQFLEKIAIFEKFAKNGFGILGNWIKKSLDLEPLKMEKIQKLTKNAFFPEFFEKYFSKFCEKVKKCIQKCDTFDNFLSGKVFPKSVKSVIFRKNRYFWHIFDPAEPEISQKSPKFRAKRKPNFWIPEILCILKRRLRRRIGRNWLPRNSEKNGVFFRKKGCFFHFARNWKSIFWKSPNMLGCKKWIQFWVWQTEELNFREFWGRFCCQHGRWKTAKNGQKRYFRDFRDLEAAGACDVAWLKIRNFAIFGLAFLAKIAGVKKCKFSEFSAIFGSIFAIFGNFCSNFGLSFF